MHEYRLTRSPIKVKVAWGTTTVDHSFVAILQRQRLVKCKTSVCIGKHTILRQGRQLLEGHSFASDTECASVKSARWLWVTSATWKTAVFVKDKSTSSPWSRVASRHRLSPRLLFLDRTSNFAPKVTREFRLCLRKCSVAVCSRCFHRATHASSTTTSLSCILIIGNVA